MISRGSAHCRNDEFGPLLHTGRPARSHGLRFRIEAKRIGAVLVEIAESGSLPAAKCEVGDRHRNGHVDADHADLHLRGKIARRVAIAGENGDAVAVFVLGRQADIRTIKSFRSVTGATTDPFCCWMLSRSLETVDIRMRKCAENATKIAEFLNDHPKVESVVYPTLLKEGDPQYDIYKKQCSGPGALISFYVKGGKKEAFAVLNGVEICRLAVSLGVTETLIQHPRRMTHSEVPEDMCRKVGITDSMIRISVGIEDADDLIDDLKTALDKM